MFWTLPIQGIHWVCEQSLSKKQTDCTHILQPFRAGSGRSWETSCAIGLGVKKITFFICKSWFCLSILRMYHLYPVHALLTINMLASAWTMQLIDRATFYTGPHKQVCNAYGHKSLCALHPPLPFWAHPAQAMYTNAKSCTPRCRWALGEGCITTTACVPKSHESLCPLPLI